jgi:LytS/YehU family sensor histidine kinase
VDPRESEVSFIYDIEDEDDGFLDKYGLKPYIIGFLIISLSTVIKFNNRLSKKEKENLKLSNENLSTELKFLKNQINPHFLFNVLNNLYSQVVTKSDRAPETILKLSDMLRYILYEGESEKVRIDREVEHLKNYIALQEMRDSSISQKLKFNYNLDSSIMIEPMIFIAFIENAFKHSVIDSDENGFIQINIQSKKNNIYLTVINSIPSSKFVKDKHGGIGLENVKKRLDILYRNKHMLNIEILPNLCKVELNIELNTNE